ncbi:MAG TPA: TonB-dependent receptor [Longimicrobiales bacterium]|nr:TonB-dependent receptor [Longimicrobiales bacterium]
MHGSLDPRASVGNVVRRGAALALGLFASMGWIPGTVAEAGAQQAGVVTGVVVSAERREPLADVRVVIEGTDLGALTDVRGRYRIAGVPAGSRVVVASAMGRVTGRETVTVPAGGAVSVEFALAEDALLMRDMVVSVSREAQRRSETAATVSVVAGEAIREARPSHPGEIMGRVPGVWVNVTGGEGHMTAIRQPKTTDPVYLYLEDGVPTRSTGFFNHNALYEVNVPQADRIEVIKGPATTLYGSDAIGGIVNVGTRPPAAHPEFEASAEGGSYGWARLLLSGSTGWGANGVRGDLNLSRTDGWREGTDYDRVSATLRWDRALEGRGSLKVVATYSDIDQQTAGSSTLNRDDYENNPTRNYTPISFRKVRAFRFSAAWERVGERSLVSVTPFFRHNEMDLLPNWSLTYDPVLSETFNRSFGVLAKYRRDFDRLRGRLIAGVDVDYSPGGRLEWVVVPERDGPVFVNYTLGNVVYDYDVTFRGVSPYVHGEVSLTDRLRLTGGLRYDLIGYDYDNALGELTTGSHRRPADGTVTYRHLSPKLGATVDVGGGANLFVAYQHGFRAPSEGQLFRQGRSENSVGLKPVKADNIEVGLRGQAGGRLSYELAAYRMEKRDDILTYTHTDGMRETVNAGRTLHRGVEAGLGVAVAPAVRLDVSYAYSKHTYEEWRPTETTDLGGNEMADAPRHMGSAVLTLMPALLRGGRAGIEYERIGSYWMDPENTHKYDGHGLVHARVSVPVNGRFELYARVRNVLDERYAENASYTQARGEEYAPGLGRTVYVGVQYR